VTRAFEVDHDAVIEFQLDRQPERATSGRRPETQPRNLFAVGFAALSQRPSEAASADSARRDPT
jgi:hypothetical protein